MNSRLMALVVFILVAISCSDNQEYTSLDQKYTSLNIDYSKLTQAKPKNSFLVNAGGVLLEQYIKNGIRIKLRQQESTQVIWQMADSGQYKSQFSTTNLHQVGVDEADRIKIDDDLLYLVEDRYFPPSKGERGYGVRVMRLNEHGPDAAEVGFVVQPETSTSLDNVGIFLHQNGTSKLLVSLHATQRMNIDLSTSSEKTSWQTGKTQVIVDNVTSPTAVSREWQIDIEGNLESSRKVGHHLYLLTRFIPSISGLNFHAATDKEHLKNEELVASAMLTDLIPDYQINGTQRVNLVRPEECLVPQNIKVGEGHADMLTLTSINLNTMSLESSLCLNTKVDGVYASTNNIYFSGSGVDTGVESKKEIEGTVLHKISLTDGTAENRGSAWVKGHLGWSDPAFKMNEYNGYLRVVTSLFENEQLEHYLSVLEDVGNQKFQIMSQIPNLDSSQAIGKLGEDIFAVRFDEQRAYIVTYEQSAPLYIINLSDPSAPFIEGELQVSGFTPYLHPIDTDWVIGVGHHVESGVLKGLKMELYDFSTPEQAKVADSLIIGGEGTWSEVTSDLRSFSTLSDSLNNWTLTLPVNRYTRNENGAVVWSDSGLFVFQVRKNNGQYKLALAGNMLSEFASSKQNYPESWGVGRSIMKENTVYYYQGNKLWGAKESALEQLEGVF